MAEEMKAREGYGFSDPQIESRKRRGGGVGGRPPSRAGRRRIVNERGAARWRDRAAQLLGRAKS